MRKRFSHQNKPYYMIGIGMKEIQ